MNPTVFLLLNVALAFYGVGAIWAHKVDIFRSWKLIGDRDTFRRVQSAHWRKLPYWVFAPVGLTLIGSVALIWYHPAGSPAWGIWGGLATQLAPHVLTAALWGPWQVRLSEDSRGSASPCLTRILSTHWMRTLLINAYAAILLLWTIRLVG